MLTPLFCTKVESCKKWHIKFLHTSFFDVYPISFKKMQLCNKLLRKGETIVGTSWMQAHPGLLKKKSILISLLQLSLFHIRCQTSRFYSCCCCSSVPPLQFNWPLLYENTLIMWMNQCALCYILGFKYENCSFYLCTSYDTPELMKFDHGEQA